MYGRKYVNLVEISSVVLEIQKAEFSNFTVPVNNTFVCRTSSFVFLATDTLLCILIDDRKFFNFKKGNRDQK